MAIVLHASGPPTMPPAAEIAKIELYLFFLFFFLGRYKDVKHRAGFMLYRTTALRCKVAARVLARGPQTAKYAANTLGHMASRGPGIGTNVCLVAISSDVCAERFEDAWIVVTAPRLCERGSCGLMHCTPPACCKSKVQAGAADHPSPAFCRPCCHGLCKQRFYNRVYR